MEDETTDLSERRIDAKAELEKHGLKLPGKPSFSLPRVPVRLTDWDEEAVMQLFVQIVRFQDYVHGLQVITEIDESALSNKLDIVKARCVARNYDGSSSARVAIAKAEATLDDEVLRCNDSLIRTKARRKLYEVILDSLNRDAALVSREITRRVSGRDRENRADRFVP